MSVTKVRVARAGGATTLGNATEPPPYPDLDAPASYAAPWGSYTRDTLIERARAIAAAAMTCYLELTDSLTPTSVTRSEYVA